MQVEFMQPGHTHNDVDADFGNFAQLCESQDAWTLTEIMDLYLRAVSNAGKEATKRSFTALRLGVATRAAATLVESVPDFEKFYSHETVRVCALSAQPFPCLRWHSADGNGF